MTKVYLDPSQVPARLRGTYSGKKFAAHVCTSVSIPATAGLWDGGSREYFYGLNLETGETREMAGQSASPFSRDYSRGDTKVDLLPGYAIVRHSHFCGKDMGLEFFIHPDNATALLPASQSALTPFEKYVLTATRSLKSSYAGRDRYEMAQGEYSCTKVLNGEPVPSRAQWDETKAALIAKGLLNRAGAITPAGRNAVPH